MIFAVFYVWSLIALTLCYKTPVFDSWSSVISDKPISPLMYFYVQRYSEVTTVYSALEYVYYYYIDNSAARTRAAVQVIYWGRCTITQIATTVTTVCINGIRRKTGARKSGESRLQLRVFSCGEHLSGRATQTDLHVQVLWRWAWYRGFVWTGGRYLQ